MPSLCLECLEFAEMAQWRLRRQMFKLPLPPGWPGPWKGACEGTGTVSC